MQIVVKNRQKKIPVNKRATAVTIARVLRVLRIKEEGQLTVIFVDNNAILKLNHRFLGKPYPTDVICFDLSDNFGFSADIAISSQMAYENSLIYNTSVQYELKLYIVHGILHLFGYDDQTKEDRLRMQRKTKQILKQI